MDSATRLSLHVEGMTCGSCVARVERALRNVSGVTDARVNLTTETATVHLASMNGAVPALIAAVRAAGYDAEPTRQPTDELLSIPEQRDDIRSRRQRQALIQALGLAAPVLALEYLAPYIESTHPGGHIWWRTLQAILCTMMLISPAGAPILVGGLRALWHRAPNMDLLIALGVVTAYVSSVIGLITHLPVHYHFEMAAMILGFINVGRYLESRSRREATGAVAALARRMPKTALRLRDGVIETIPVADVRIGDHLRVPEDTLIPVDGRVITGTAAVDESAVTGESVPVPKTEGDSVLGGTLVSEGVLTVDATRLGAESAIGRVLRAVQEAQTGKTRWQRIADQVAGIFVPIVIGLSALTFAGWVIALNAGWTTMPTSHHGTASYSPWEWGLLCAIGVLVIACPCALGLATPTAVLVATGTAALRGILVRDAAVLENAGRVDMVLFDKTGTLTAGKHVLKHIITIPDEGLNESELPARLHRLETGGTLLAWAASAEQYSQHPLAKAIVDHAQAQGLSLTDADEFHNDAGLGVRARFGEVILHVGSARFLRQNSVDLGSVTGVLDQLAAEGVTVVLVAGNGRAMGVIGLADSVRRQATESVRRLKELNLRCGMVTGDSSAAAKAIASEVGIVDVHAEQSPEEKMAEVHRAQQAGHRVAFVGDGINDAPALTAADVGFAFAAGTDLAVEAADITLVGDDLNLIPHAIELARRSVRVIKQNLFWAFFYNVAAIPLAAIGAISPRYAAAAMMFSSLSVVLNSLRLRT